jgi:ankyrin repeat protein
MKSLTFTLICLLSAFSSPLIAQEAEVVVDWEVFQTGTPAEVEAEIEELSKKGSLNVRDSKGKTPLIHAVQFMNLKVISALIDAGADVDEAGAEPNFRGKTPLMYAGKALLLNEELINVLVNAGANVNARDENGGTPLIYAAINSHTSKAVAALIKSGANVNDATNYGSTALMYAAQYNLYVDTIEILLEKGAEIEARTSNGDTALMYAAKNRWNNNKSVRGAEGVDIVNALIKAGADVKARNVTGDTVLFGASNGEVVNALIKAGADIEARNGLGWTPLFFSTLESIPALVKAGVDINAVDSVEGITALAKAASYDISKDRIFKLIELGANLEIGSVTPLMFAARPEASPPRETSVSLEIISVLIQAGANLEAENYTGTPLIYAVSYGRSPEIVSALISAGANVKAKDGILGETTIALATKNKNIYKTDAYWELNDAFHNQ